MHNLSRNTLVQGLPLHSYGICLQEIVLDNIHWYDQPTSIEHFMWVLSTKGRVPNSCRYCTFAGTEGEFRQHAVTLLVHLTSLQIFSQHVMPHWHTGENETVWLYTRVFDTHL